jgi:hypothetical protein
MTSPPVFPSFAPSAAQFFVSGVDSLDINSPLADVFAIVFSRIYRAIAVLIAL